MNRRQAIGRWVAPLLALFVLGPLAYAACAWLSARDGSQAVTLLVNANIVLGVLVLLVVLAIAAAAAFIGRLVDAVTALRSGGLVLAWAAMGMGRASSVFLLEQGFGTVLLLALEAACVTLAAGVLALVFWRPAEDETQSAERTLWLPALVAAAAALLGAWLVAQSDLRAQGVLAASLGAVLAGVAARLTAHSMSQDDAPAAPYLGMLIAAVLAPLTALAFPGLGNLENAAFLNATPPLISTVPLDWAAGALLGVPLGQAWVASLAPSADRATA